MTGLLPSEVARKLGCKPRDVSMLFYDRRLPEALAPIHNGRRRIQVAALPEVERVLRASGKLPSVSTGA